MNKKEKNSKKMYNKPGKKLNQSKLKLYKNKKFQKDFMTLWNNWKLRMEKK